MIEIALKVILIFIEKDSFKSILNLNNTPNTKSVRTETKNKKSTSWIFEKCKIRNPNIAIKTKNKYLKKFKFISFVLMFKNIFFRKSERVSILEKRIKYAPKNNKEKTTK